MSGSTNSTTVSQLDKSDIRSIGTAQVVDNIAGACKELIENALDAGATAIDIRIVDHGVTSLEVCDNGSGIKKVDFEGLAKAHWTSKLAEFDDLAKLKTYGFRGEALHALAALSKLTIITRHASVETASKLEFEFDGLLKKVTPCARPVGTTVVIENFLQPLAVRRKDFEKNAIKEFQKLLNVVQSYCLILKNVRMELSHRMDNKQKKTILSTHANQTYKENICNIFEARQLETLMDFVQVAPLKEQLAENGFPEDAPVQDFAIEGLVSSIDKNASRSSTDRQFICVNSRPCELPKVLKTINQIYHRYINNGKQYPFVLLNIQVKDGTADVNVTPDKRQVMIKNESLLYLIIKTSLSTLYDNLLGVCKLGEAASSSSVINTSSTTTLLTSAIIQNGSSDKHKRPCPISDIEILATTSTTAAIILDDQPAPKQPRVESTCTEFRHGDPIGAATIANGISTDYGQMEACGSAERRASAPAATEVEGGSRSSTDVSNSTAKDFIFLRPRRDFENSASSMEPINDKPMRKPNMYTGFISASKKNQDIEKTTLDSWITNRHRSSSSGSNSDGNSSGFSNGRQRQASLRENEIDDVDYIRPPSRPRRISNNEGSRSTIGRIQRSDLPLEGPWSGYRKFGKVQFSFDRLRQCHEDKTNEMHRSGIENNVEDEFQAKITPSDNVQAELELKRHLKKTDFSSMQAIGQFNLGFILARLHDDVFIIDQHAGDEKYRFEALEKKASFQSQKLLTPVQLELSATQEQVVADRLAVFQRNGFDFSAEATNPPGKRFLLSAIPSCSSCVFDKSDVEEIIAILHDDPNLKMYRPAKLRRIFASRACRDAIMIGDALDKRQMKNVLQNLGQLDHPWNCPHGRPTVRHLFNVNQIPRIENAKIEQ